jgi:thiamine pyrophosphokinase
LLEWSPTVIATNETAEKLTSSGIKIDWVISDGDDDNLQSDVKLMSRGEDNVADAALKHLVSNEYPTVNIITADFKLEDYEHFADKINLVVFHGNKRIYPVTPGFSKWKPGGETIELISKVKDFECSGLEQVGDQQYKTVKDGIFSMRFKEPFLFIAEDV